VLKAGDLELDRTSHRVRRSGREVHLGPTEYRLLEYLMRHPGRVYSREQLLDGVWGNDVYVDERTVDVHVGRLRKAINRAPRADPIRTVRGAGYAFDERFSVRRRATALILRRSVREASIRALRRHRRRYRLAFAACRRI
jgi:two-component system phosphate regulon response regulator PhoB